MEGKSLNRLRRMDDVAKVEARFDEGNENKTKPLQSTFSRNPLRVVDFHSNEISSMDS